MYVLVDSGATGATLPVWMQPTLQGYIGPTGSTGVKGETGGTGLAGPAGNSDIITSAQVGGTYTLALTDYGKQVEQTSINTNWIVVPPWSSVGWTGGTQINIVQAGAGQTIISAGAGVTILSEAGKLKLASQYSSATLINRATTVGATSNTWYLFGNLTL
jgi:hypothetical protein